MNKSLSLVVPTYKQEKTIIRDILYLNKVLSLLPYKSEIIVVIDGRVDKSYEKLKKAKIKNVKIISYIKNQGKGFAVRKGMLKAKGDIIAFMDAGLDINPSALSIALSLMQLHDADIVLGSKLHPDSIVNYPLSRKILSVGYRSITRLLFKFEVKDTQVGLKIFKKKVVRDVFPRIIVKTYAFDVEVLAVARLLGYDKIHETPIKLKFRQGSITNSNFWKISFWMLVDTLAIFYRINIIKYYNKK
ncbi:MAG: glycosyltransferase [Patescibacteria group bacterium]